MSNKHWIKGMKRKAARKGFGRGDGSVAALVEQVQRLDREEAERRVNIARIKAERRISEQPKIIGLNRTFKTSSLDKLAQQDDKRKQRVRKGVRT